MNVSTAWILFKIIDEVDTSTVNCQLSTIHCESAKFQFIVLLRTGRAALPCAAGGQIKWGISVCSGRRGDEGILAEDIRREPQTDRERKITT